MIALLPRFRIATTHISVLGPSFATGSGLQSLLVLSGEGGHQVSNVAPYRHPVLPQLPSLLMFRVWG